MKKSKLFIRSLLIVCRTLWSHVNSNILVDSDRMTVILHNSAFCASKSDTMESMNLPESPNQLKLTYFFWQKKSPQTTNNATHLFESLLRKPFSAHSFLLELFAIFGPLISTGAVCHFRSTHFCCSCVNKPLMKSTYLNLSYGSHFRPTHFCCSCAVCGGRGGRDFSWPTGSWLPCFLLPVGCRLKHWKLF